MIIFLSLIISVYENEITLTDIRIIHMPQND